MNQHYVPRVYLKNFGTRKRNEYYVDVYDKIENRYFNVNVKNICSEKELYTLSKDSKFSKNQYLVEKFFSDYSEPMYNRAYDLLTDDNVFEINNYQRIELLIGLFQFHSRNPLHIKNAIEKHEEIITKKYYKLKAENKESFIYISKEYSITKQTLDDILNDVKKRTLNSFKDKNISEMAKVGTFHESIIIRVEKSSDGTQFLTGDNPIPNYDGLQENNYPYKKSMEFFIPLNTEYCVHLFHDNSKKQNIIYRSMIPNGSISTINDKIFKQSHKFIVGSNSAVNEYFTMRERIESISMDDFMDIIDQIVQKGPHPIEQNRMGNSLEVLKKYVNIYKMNGKLSTDEYNEMVKYVMSKSKDAIAEKIK